MGGGVERAQPQPAPPSRRPRPTAPPWLRRSGRRASAGVVPWRRALLAVRGKGQGSSCPTVCPTRGVVPWRARHLQKGGNSGRRKKEKGKKMTSGPRGKMVFLHHP